MQSSDQPFWKDAPETSLEILPRPMKWFVGFISISLNLMILLAIAILLSVWPILMWIWIAFYGMILGRSIYFLFRIKNSVQTADEVQRLALGRVGASHIGSALHVAGHPLLGRDQPVVLALVGEQLNIYSYENSTPLDTIPLRNFQAVRTVSYDDERVPHSDTIDSAAQALQLEFLWRDQPCACLFRRMRKVRPIDWYHDIQQARLQSGLLRSQESIR